MRIKIDYNLDKEIMKSLKLTVLAVASVLFLRMADLEAQETIIVKVYEFPANANSRIMVINPEGGVTEIELAKMLSPGEQNIILIQREIDKWKREGYKLTHTSAGGLPSGLITTFILEK